MLTIPAVKPFVALMLLTRLACIFAAEEAAALPLCDIDVWKIEI
jgi:hypothetical protein